LKVQERQNRVCTTIAIAIVAETCQPFTVLPAVMNEYRTPEQNVQNGVLKTMSFLFEYIGAHCGCVFFCVRFQPLA
jgi:splicing factor 3B subunit 1